MFKRGIKVDIKNKPKGKTDWKVNRETGSVSFDLIIEWID
jgi:hypothetical protein